MTNCYPPTEIGFAENQLSPRLPSILPLPTSHPRILQHSSVRPTACSWVSRAVSGLIDVTYWVSSRVLATPINLLVHYAKGTLAR